MRHTITMRHTMLYLFLCGLPFCNVQEPNYISVRYEPPRGKTNNVVSEQV